MLAQNIKKARTDKHLSQRALADIIGVSQQTVGSWEVGRTSPDNEMLKKLAAFFNVSVDYLLGRTDEPDGFQKGLLGDINGDSPLAQKARMTKPNLDSEDLLAQLHQEGIMLDGCPLTAADAERLRDTIAFAIAQAKKTQGQQ